MQDSNITYINLLNRQTIVSIKGKSEDNIAYLNPKTRQISINLDINNLEAESQLDDFLDKALNKSRLQESIIAEPGNFKVTREEFQARLDHVNYKEEIETFKDQCVDLAKSNQKKHCR